MRFWYTPALPSGAPHGREKAKKAKRREKGEKGDAVRKLLAVRVLWR
jgi:hypothetical protein